MALPTVQLASQSPRRRMLLEACALDVRVLKQEGDETWPQLPTPAEVMEELARIKLKGAVMPTLTTRLSLPILPSGLMVNRWASLLIPMMQRGC